MIATFNFIKRAALLVLMFQMCLSVKAGNDGMWFFSDSDKVAIKQSASTAWGKMIVETMKAKVAERRTHSLAAPLLEGGHLHDYFCPIHNLSFDFEWDKPYEHYCSACRKYWKGNKRHDWAWVNKLHAENLQYLENCTYLYLATSDTVYAGYIRDMLLDYADKYPTYFEHNTNRVATALNSGRMFGQSLDESVWASDAVRAYSVAKEVMKQSEIAKIEKGYLRQCADMLLKRRGGGNWQVWHNSGLIALGVALDDAKVIDVALNDSVCGYHALMKRHVHDDGWWNEGSPTYHYYPLRAMMLSAEALRCRGINLYDGKLMNMLASPAQGAYADLSFPAHNDGWYGESLLAQTKLYEWAYARYKTELFKNILVRCYQVATRNLAEALFNPVDFSSGKVSGFGQGVNFADLGVSVLRYADITLVMKYGPYGGGHGHPDKLSVSLHNGRHEVLPDLGTSAYGVPDFTQWYRKTLAHNTVTVDGKDQAPESGRLVKFQPTGVGGTVVSAVDDAYEGVSMQRSVTLKKNRMTDVYECTSADNHTYDYVLLLTEPFESEGLIAADGAVLDDAPVYSKIKELKKYSAKRRFTVVTADSKAEIEVPAGEVEVYSGVAPGIPPTNPGVVTKNHTESRMTQPCYPLIIRIKGKSMKVNAQWTIKQ